MPEVRCPRCGGSGRFGTTASGQKCQHCFGTGRIMVEKPNPPSGKQCFPADVLIRTAAGARSIAEIQAGDFVMAYDRNGMLAPQRVAKKTSHKVGSVVVVRTDGEWSVVATAAHAVLTPRGWKRIADLRTGDDVIQVTTEGERLVRTVLTVSSRGLEPVYNLIVEHHYSFVTDGGCVAHSFSYCRSARVMAHELARIARNLLQRFHGFSPTHSRTAQ